ncbi:MAG TPA: MoaD/ThiS family protein, partial [Ignavibacteria bacterium]|nr:MoaD/ThiS family protein [Ignavibacteria bacterium]HMR40786.1 MoaD/ThiS family protein [Ignavibacteria bacterium]
KLFGILADKTGSSEIEFEIDNTVDAETLLTKINKKFPEFEKTNYAVAVNKKVVSGDHLITSNDEIALLPPFAGG